jgi:hypothetical protein
MAQHIIELAVAEFEAKHQWFNSETLEIQRTRPGKVVGEVIHYLKNEDGQVYLFVYYDHEKGVQADKLKLTNNWSSRGLLIGLLVPDSGGWGWELSKALVSDFPRWQALCAKQFMAHLKKIAPKRKPETTTPKIKYLGPDGAHAASSGKEPAYAGCKTWEQRKAINMAAAQQHDGPYKGCKTWQERRRVDEHLAAMA